ncbi:sensor histidine kinase [Halorarius halobius]|uniref:sensor histidine kinase n=1 Tax=Halorarius halobius TaxID=2962671 RepID=UPI0020CB775A|nr:GAF domain-containing sensor histidine kinase [Halorarius halobius]
MPTEEVSASQRTTRRVYVTDDALRERVAALDGLTVVDDPSTADCVVTDSNGAAPDARPTVIVADALDDVDGSPAGFVRTDATDATLSDQIRLAARRTAPSKAARLPDVTRDIVACEDPEEVYRLAVSAAERVLDLDGAYVAEAGETYFQPKASAGVITDDGVSEEMRVDEGLAGRTYQSGESMVVDDLTDSGDAKPVDPDYRSGLSVPLGDVGVFQAASMSPDAFDERDRELVELLMSHAAETVTRLRTEQRLREERRIIERLHASTTELLACETETELCRQLVTAAERILEFEVCTVLLADSDDGPLRLVASSDSPLAPDPDGPERTVPVDVGVVGRTYREGESILVHDVADVDDARPYDDAYRSALSVPFGEWGVVTAIADQPGAFDEQDRDLLELFVTQAAAALARLRAEQELVAERDRLEEFASVLSHDLRNPLNVATGYLELARESGDTGHLDRVAASLDRMDALVEDVLTLAREPATAETAPVDLESRVETAARGVELDTVRIDGPLPDVNADADALLRLLENLFRNAVEHAGPDPTVRVAPLYEDGEAVGFRVGDDGPGIPPEEREAVFESGYTTGTGTGLGLPIVRSIADAHGWAVTIGESELGGVAFEVRTG